MRKLGRKLVSEQETLEAYCFICSHCSCGCSCSGYCGVNGTTYNQAIESVNKQYSSNTGSQQSSNSAAAVNP